MKRVYLSGPITGHPNHRIEFAEAGVLVAAMGAIPVDPHDIPAACEDFSCLDGGVPPNYDGKHSWDCYMRGDIAVLMGCDEVVLLKGWETSKGATLEQFVARTVGIPVKELHA